MTEVTKEEYATRRKAWIDALRSGKYKQGHGCLGDDVQGYCCLGVGCAVTGVKFHHTDAVSVEFTKWVGLRLSVGVCEINNRITSLMRMNDNVGYTFDQIADVIESNPPELWKDGTF